MRKCFIISIILLSLVLAGTAEAKRDNNNNLCKDNWASAQTSEGGAFTSRHECQKSEMFLPSLTLDPTSAVAFEHIAIRGSGFHPSSAVTVSFAVFGQPAYHSFQDSTGADGSYSQLIYFPGCGYAPPYDLVVTVTDSFGVHASARMTLC